MKRDVDGVMGTEILRLCYLFLPLLGGALALGLCTRYDWLSPLAVPIDGGWRWRGRRFFGAHKTVRGLLMPGIGASLTMVAQAELLHRLPNVRALESVDYATIQPWLVGFLLGLAAQLGELPNSFLKRQLGVVPGGTGRGASGAMFYVADQIDILLGSWLVLAWVTEVTLSRVLISVVGMLAAHQLVSVLGYATGMKKSIG